MTRVRDIEQELDQHLSSLCMDDPEDRQTMARYIARLIADHHARSRETRSDRTARRGTRHLADRPGILRHSPA
jgi:hypothetical protein